MERTYSNYSREREMDQNQYQKNKNMSTPYTPKRDMNSSFESRGTASASKMVNEVIAVLDRQVEDRKRELHELLQSRSASKNRLIKKTSVSYCCRCFCFISLFCL
jgi:putative cell wall-binding protein